MTSAPDRPRVATNVTDYFATPEVWQKLFEDRVTLGLTCLIAFYLITSLSFIICLACCCRTNTAHTWTNYEVMMSHRWQPEVATGPEVRRHRRGGQVVPGSGQQSAQLNGQQSDQFRGQQKGQFSGQPCSCNSSKDDKDICEIQF